jgi:hypothetical protein
MQVRFFEKLRGSAKHWEKVADVGLTHLFPATQLLLARQKPLNKP